MEDPTPDAILLAKFRKSRDGAAFKELVGRYLGMILGVALRKTGDRGGAEEIAQNTFSILAKKADALPKDVVLGGWLHRVATIEAAEFNRKEYRRRDVMKQLQEASDADNESPEAMAFAEYLPDLDEALGKLSAGDRDAIMLRFHAGMRFREMAKRLGKSEEAARKQVTRALDRLGTLLGKKRGAAVTAATLGAGLSLALNKTAPAAMVSSIATTAITAAPAIAAGTSLTLKLLYAMKTQLGIVAAIGILLVAGSFFAGRQSAAGFGEEILEEAQASAAQRQKLAARAEATAAELQTKPQRTVQQILDDATSQFRQDSSTAGWYRVRLVLEELAPEDYPDAAAHLLTNRGDGDVHTFETIGALLAGLWAGVDGESAVAWVEENLDAKRGVGFQNVMEMWSTHAPEDAYAWYRERGKEGDSGMRLSSFRWLSTRVFTGWAETDPSGAVAALQDVSIEDERGALHGFADAVQHAPNPEPILNAIEAMGEGRLRNKLIEEVAGDWAREEVHAAAAWLDEIPMESAKARLIAKGEVAEAWMRRDPDDMLDIGVWFLAGAPDDMREYLTDMVAHGIAEQESKGKEKTK